MNISIRKFLLINLLLAITLTTSLTVLGNYFLDKQDIDRHLDALMANSALSFQSLLGNSASSIDFKSLQQAINHIPTKLNQLTQRKLINQHQQNVAQAFNFQLWDEQWNLLLRSPGAPSLPLSPGDEGYSTQQDSEGQFWRVYTAYDQPSGVMIMIGEQLNARTQFGHTIALDDIIIMLFTFPLSGILIWVIIGKGLTSLNRIAEEVSSRAPHYLEKVELNKIPLEIKPMIDSLNLLFDRLQQAFDREKRFAADAAHELRTPLAVLKTQAQVAQGSDNDQERQQALNNLMLGVDRCSHIVKQLLTMSRLLPETDYIAGSTKVDLIKVASDEIAQLVPLALEKNIEIELCPQGRHHWINGNPTALGILCRNLIDNAIRYSEAKSEVRVQIRATASGFTVLEVIDNGPGIPKELHERVFERFFRVVGTKPTGSGLGLSIVYQIASLHQAEVELTTPRSGAGLLIRVRFPPRATDESS